MFKMMTMMLRVSLRRWDEWLACILAVILCIFSPGYNTSLLKAHRTVYACENSTLRLQCGPGEVIQLVRANFGRYSITICNEHGNTAWSVRCSSARAIFVLSDRCDQKQECSVLASEFVFGDPCPNTLKYLEAHYKCTPAIAEIPEQKTPPPWLTTAAPQRAATEPPFKPPPPPFAFTTTSTTTTTAVTTTTTSRTSTPPPQTSTSTTTTVVKGSTEKAIAAKVSTSTVATTSDLYHKASPSSTARPSHQAARADFAPAVVVPRRPVIETHSHVDFHGQQEDVTDIRHIDTQTDQDVVIPSVGDNQDQFDLGGHLTEQEKIAFQRNHCPPIEARHIFWNWTEAGQTAVERCPGSSSGAALWRCRLDNTATPQWFQHPDLSECRSPWLGQLELQLKRHSSVLEVATDLSRATDSTSMYGGDLNMAVRLVNLLPAQLNGNSHQLPEDEDQREAVVAELTKTVVSSTSNLLSERQRPMWSDFERPERMAVVTSLLLGMEENAFLLASNLAKAKSVMQSGENLVMSVRLLRTDWSSGPAEFPSADERQVLANFHDSISIPYAALQANAHNSQVRLVFMFYDGMDAILTPSSQLVDEDNEAPHQIVNSRVVSASLGKGRHIPLPVPATITLHHLHTENVSNPRCVFWDYTVNQWSQQGCRLASTNLTHTQCLCDHLTNFAVLMDVHAVQLSTSDAWALELITYTGCSISIVCLVLALITFQLLKGLKSDRTSIHKNLCLCLLIGEVVFLAGINQTQEPIVCGIVAGLLHYFFLCAFAWMFFEGFQLYVMLIEVFEVERSRIRWYYALAYGTPAVIVAVSCIVNPHNYGTDQYCWLRSDNYFIFAFVGPVVAVILANLVFLGMAVSMMCRHSVATVTMKAKEQSRLSSFSRDDECILLMKFRAHLAWIRGAVALVFLLGLTWALGLLYVSQRTVTIAYAFTIFNSLQGLFIFFFHCVQNEKMRSEYKRRFRQLISFCDCLGASKGTSSGTGSSAAFNNSGGSAGGKSQQHQSSFLTASTSTSHCHGGLNSATAGNPVASSVSSSASVGTTLSYPCLSLLPLGKQRGWPAGSCHNGTVQGAVYRSQRHLHSNSHYQQLCFAPIDGRLHQQALHSNQHHLYAEPICVTPKLLPPMVDCDSAYIRASDSPVSSVSCEYVEPAEWYQTNKNANRRAQGKSRRSKLAQTPLQPRSSS